MNTQALQRITNPEPPPAGASGERIRTMQRRAKTTAALIAELQRPKPAPLDELDAEVQGWMDLIAGRV